MTKSHTPGYAHSPHRNQLPKQLRTWALRLVAAALIGLTVDKGVVEPWQQAEAAASAQQANARTAVKERAAPVMADIGQKMYALWLQQQNSDVKHDTDVTTLTDKQKGEVRFISVAKRSEALPGYTNRTDISVIMGLGADGKPDPSRTKVVFIQNVSTVPNGSGEGWDRVWLLAPNSASEDGFDYDTGDYYRIIEQERSPYNGDAGGYDTEHVDLGGLFGDPYGLSVSNVPGAAAGGAGNATRMWQDYVAIVAAPGAQS